MGGGHQHIDQSVAQVGGSAFECGEGCLSCCLCGLSGLHLAVFGHHVDEVDLLVGGFVGAVDLEESEVGELDAFAVEVGYFCRAVDHRGVEFGYADVAQCFEQHLIAHAVDVTVSDPDTNFSILFHFFDQCIV